MRLIKGNRGSWPACTPFFLRVKHWQRNKKSSFGYLGGFGSQLMVSKDGIGVEKGTELWVRFEAVLTGKFMGLSEHGNFGDYEVPSFS